MARRRANDGINSGAALIDLVARKYKLPGLIGRHRLFAIWDRIVGERYAEICRPEKLQGDTLVVTVIDSVWGQQIRMLEKEFIARIAEETGNDAIKRLRVVTGDVEPRKKEPRLPALSQYNVETEDLDEKLHHAGLTDRPQLKNALADLWADMRRAAKRRREANSGKK